MKGGNAASHRPSSAASNLVLRIISAVVLAPIVLIVVWWGGLVFGLVVGLVGLLVYLEWLQVTAGSGSPMLDNIGAIGLMASALLLTVGFTDAATGVSLFTVAVVVLGLPVRRNALWILAGLVYAGMIIVSLVSLRSHPVHGLAAIAVVLACVWATDIAAYVCGRLIGGAKLWPSVSPKKTWSGAIGGMLTGGLAGYLTALAFGLASGWAMVAVSAVLSVASQAGDLLESALKRRFGVKDSSGLIPGHGGLMDRIDGLAIASVCAVGLGLAHGYLQGQVRPHPAAGLVVW